MFYQFHQFGSLLITTKSIIVRAIDPRCDYTANNILRFMVSDVVAPLGE